MQPPTLRPILAGWPHAESPFHEGERRAQERAGVADKIEGPGRRMIRAYMPDEHRELFERLPYFVAAAADAQGRLWASMLVGEAGFVRTPDEHTLRLGALPTEGDPLRPLLQPGHPVGLLGIELTTRRRNRVNGEVIARDDAGFAVRVQQSFGNCPQYIQARTPLGPRISATSAQPDVARAKPGGAQGTAGDSGSASGSGSGSGSASASGSGSASASGSASGSGSGSASGSASASASASGPRRLGAQLDDAAVAIVRNADTFFLASATPPAAPDAPRRPSEGVDVSHRGGRPGFVTIEPPAAASAPAAPTVLYAPDYRGNFMFNTIGNLELSPRAALLFLDFTRGDLLSLTADVTVSWDDPRIADFPGAQRLLRIEVVQGVHLPGVLPWRWSPPQLAPQL